jgi:hypothetical protein
VLARELIEVIATHTRGRIVHVVADGAYQCTELRRLPPHVTMTGPLHSNASLWRVHPDLDHPPRLRGRGRPRTHAARILWRGVFGARPVRVPVITEPRKPDLALVTTDLATRLSHFPSNMRATE